MARLVERSIKKPLSELLLFEEPAPGARVLVDLASDGESLLVRVAEADAKAEPDPAADAVQPKSRES